MAPEMEREIIRNVSGTDPIDDHTHILQNLSWMHEEGLINGYTVGYGVNTLEVSILPVVPAESIIVDLTLFSEET